MNFLNPYLLFGAGAVAVPIIIHLLMKRQVKRVVWAAMRFLQASVQRNEKRMRLENLLLLLVRCALLILLALALARPAFHAGGFGALAQAGAGPEIAVVAIDNSASMGQTDGVSSRFEKARQAADEIIGALPQGSSVAVLLVSDVVQPLIAEPTLDLNLARRTVREAALSSHATDLQPAFRHAVGLLKTRAGSRKSLYVLTDGQANGWAHLPEIRALLQAERDELQARVVLIGAPEDRNLGVSDLRVASAFTPARQAIRFEARVTNYGITEAKNVPVRLAVDGEDPSDEATLDAIAPGASRSVSLFATFRGAGFHSVTAQLSSDRLPADDRRTVAVRAFDQASVLLVDGSPGREPRDSAVFYLRNALTPVAPERRGDYFIRTETVSPEALETVRLNDFDAVVLANVPTLSDAARDALDRHLHRGGGLILFPGDKTDIAFYNTRLPFLPAHFGAPRGDVPQPGQAPGQAVPRHFTLRETYDHPIVSLWKDPAAGTLASARFFRAFPLEASPASAVLFYADGTPAVAERSWGLGSVIQFSSTANTAWNDLPVRPAFLPLVHRALGAILNRRSERLNVPVGGAFTHRFEPEMLGREVVVLKPGAPGGQADPAHKRTGRIDLANGEPVFRFDETDLAGEYRVAVAGDPPAMLAFAAQADPGESRVTESAPLDNLAPARAIRWSGAGAFRDLIASERGGAEAWAPLALAALLMAAFESVLATRYSRSK